MNKQKLYAIFVFVILVMTSSSVFAQTGTNASGNNVYIPIFLSEKVEDDDDLPDHWQKGLSPGVNWGLAAQYPNDVGITNHPNVLGAENFETGTVTIPTRDNLYKNNTTVIQTNTYTGNFAGEHRWAENQYGLTTRFMIPESAHQDSRPAYFMRMCMNFDDSFHPGLNNLDKPVGIKGFGVVSDPFGNTNVPSNGQNWFNAQVQFVGWGPSSKPEANDGFLWVGHSYSYNPYPDEAEAEVGEINVTSSDRFSSYADPFFYIDFGGWHCYEIGVYLNNPGKYDGEVRFWIDGVLQSRVTNVRYRDVATLLPTEMHLNLYRTTVDFPQTMIRWTDNIVLATRYIGPVKKE
jgi:hypothetical protein